MFVMDVYIYFLKQRISVFEPFAMRDTVQHFCEKHLDKIKAYMQKVFVKLPLPIRCGIEGNFFCLSLEYCSDFSMKSNTFVIVVSYFHLLALEHKFEAKLLFICNI